MGLAFGMILMITVSLLALAATGAVAAKRKGWKVLFGIAAVLTGVMVVVNIVCIYSMVMFIREWPY